MSNRFTFPATSGMSPPSGMNAPQRMNGANGISPSSTNMMQGQSQNGFPQPQQTSQPFSFSSNFSKPNSSFSMPAPSTSASSNVAQSISQANWSNPRGLLNIIKGPNNPFGNKSTPTATSTPTTSNTNGMGGFMNKSAQIFTFPKSNTNTNTNTNTTGNGNSSSTFNFSSANQYKAPSMNKKFVPKNSKNPKLPK